MGDDLSLRQRVRKSNVRIVVTYFVVFTYCTGALGISAFLFAKGQYELGLGVFNGLATLSAGIAGFWFGSRSSGFPGETPGGAADEAEASNLISPEAGTSRRPVMASTAGESSPSLSSVED